MSRLEWKDIEEAIGRNEKRMAAQFKRMNARANIGIVLAAVACYYAGEYAMRMRKLETEVGILKDGKGD